MIEPTAAVGFCARFGTWDDNRFVQSGNRIATMVSSLHKVSRPGPEHDERVGGVVQYSAPAWASVPTPVGCVSGSKMSPIHLHPGDIK